MAKKKFLKFGGPGLPPGTHTWFEDLAAPLGGGQHAIVPNAAPGQTVEYDRVKNPEHYLIRQMAEVVEANDEPARPEQPAKP